MDIRTNHGSGGHNSTTKGNSRTKTAASAESQTGPWNIIARHGEHNATELQVVTINDAEGEMADYLVLNDTRKRSRSVSRKFKKYQFSEKENEPNSMKCGFKTDKILTATKETDHTVTTSVGRTIHKKLASKPLKFQTPRKPDEPKKAITRCKRCGKFSSGKFCETHRHLDNNNNDAEE